MITTLQNGIWLWYSIRFKRGHFFLYSTVFIIVKFDIVLNNLLYLPHYRQCQYQVRKHTKKVLVRAILRFCVSCPSSRAPSTRRRPTATLLNDVNSATLYLNQEMLVVVFAIFLRFPTFAISAVALGFCVSSAKRVFLVAVYVFVIVGFSYSCR